MIEQETHKVMHARETDTILKDDAKPQSQNILNKSQIQIQGQESQNSRKSKAAENPVAQVDYGKQISKLIKIYSKQQREDQLTKEEFEQLVQDLFSMVEPRQLTREQLDNLFNLFEQKQKNPKKNNTYKAPKTFITKEQLKIKAIENQGSLGFFKKK